MFDEMACDKIKDLCARYRDASKLNRPEDAEKVIRKIKSVFRDLAEEVEANMDSAFFAKELDYNAGENEVLHAVDAYKERRQKRKDSCSVARFRERRKKRLDERFDDDDEGRWVTTENDNKVHINEEGVPDKGNPYVLKAMTSGTKTREQIGRARAEKIKTKVTKALDAYKRANGKVKEAAKKYQDKNEAYKKAERRIEFADKIYKKQLDEHGYGENDKDKLTKEIEELKKKKEENPYDREIEGQYNNKTYLLAAWEDCYGEETKQFRKNFEKLKSENDSAKKELQKHIDARKAALAEAREHMGEKDAQKMKFYNADERREIAKQIIDSDGFKNLSEEEKNVLSSSIDGVSDAQLAMLKKASEHAKIMRYEDTAATTGCSHYSSGTGCMYIEEDDRKNPEVFWHEFGHYMDDFRYSGLEYSLVTFGEGSVYEGSTNSFSDVLRNSVKIRGADAAKDLQDMLDTVMPDKFEVFTNDTEDYLSIRDKKTGDTFYDSPKFALALQNSFDEVVHEYLHGGKDGGELGEYYRSIGYPSYDERPNRDDYIEEYTTPKRGLRREREKYKGAREAYYNELQKFYDKQEVVKAEHPEFYEKEKELYARRREREKHIPAVTDCLCGALGGAVFSIYGCHDMEYYRRGFHVENEWSANIHQMMFMQDKEALGLLEKLMPRTMKKVKTAYNEYLWRNMAI